MNRMDENNWATETLKGVPFWREGINGKTASTTSGTASAKSSATKVSAYSKKENAESMVKKLKAAGFEASIVS